MNRTTLAQASRCPGSSGGSGEVSAGAAGTEHRAATRISKRLSKLEAVVSHESAGQLHQFDGLPWIPPTVTVPHRSPHRFPGVLVHQSTDISDDDVVSIDGLPVTDPGAHDHRSGGSHERAAARLGCSIERCRQESSTSTSSPYVFAGLGRRGKPGTSAIRRLLETRGQAYVPPDTVLEQRLLAIIEDAGLPRPTPQFAPAVARPDERARRLRLSRIIS